MFDALHVLLVAVIIFSFFLPHTIKHSVLLLSAV